MPGECLDGLVVIPHLVSQCHQQPLCVATRCADGSIGEEIALKSEMC